MRFTPLENCVALEETGSTTIRRPSNVSTEARENFGQVRAVASIATVFLIQTRRRLRTRIERGYKRLAACAVEKSAKINESRSVGDFVDIASLARFPSFSDPLIVLSYRKRLITASALSRGFENSPKEKTPLYTFIFGY